MKKSKPSYHKAADLLRKETKADWYVIVHHSVNEPVCAFVDIYSDDPALPVLKGCIGEYDVNNSIRKACEMMLEKLREEDVR